MRRLIVMRHAKSSWTDPLMHDAARPLNERGRRAAPVMGRWLKDRGYAPDLALVSTARRTLETWELAAPEMVAEGERRPQHASEPAIYNAGTELLLNLALDAPEEVETLLILGHEPGAPGLVRLLAGPEMAAGCERAFGKYPTGAVSVLEFDTARWRALAAGTGRFAAYAQPRDFD